MFTANKNKRIKLISESAIESHKIKILDEKTSLNEVIFGGRILNLVNDVAIQVANKHSEISCYTLGVDFIRYYSFIKASDSLICKSQINRVWDNILEVGVTVVAEDFRSLENRKILSAYFTIKATDQEIPDIMPVTLSDKKRFQDALKRKEIRDKKSIY